MNDLNKEVIDLRKKVHSLEENFLEEKAYKVDLWACEEIQNIKGKANSSLLEGTSAIDKRNTNICMFDTTGFEGLNSMKVLVIQHLKPLVIIRLKIQDKDFKLNFIIDSGEVVNMLHKDFIPTKYWRKTSHAITVVGNTLISLAYEVSKATLCFEHHCLDMKFFFLEIPVACILGTPFLAAVKPYGSTRTPKGKVASFITLPNIKIRKGNAKFIHGIKIAAPFCLYSTDLDGANCHDYPTERKENTGIEKLKIDHKDR